MNPIDNFKLGWQFGLNLVSQNLVLGNRGQIQQVISAGIAFIVLALCLVLVGNIQGNTTVNPQNAVPFFSLFGLAAAGAIIIGVVLAIANMIRQ